VYELKFLSHSVLISDDIGTRSVEGLRESLAKRTISLYTDILEYQIRAALQYSRSTFLRGLRNEVALDRWKSKVKDIDTLHVRSLFACEYMLEVHSGERAWSASK
jgi:N-terminal domain of NWD NACHT-NTPase